MKPEFAQLGFKIEETSDGSLTLRLGSGEECMHHSGGAAKETNYIYGLPIRSALKAMPEASTCVVGLGLGYIELAWALCEPCAEARLTSYEIVQPLVKNFKAWLVNGNDGFYNLIVTKLCDEPQIEKVRNRLLSNFLNNEVRGDVRQGPYDRWNIVCYDAFSKQSSSELWDERFLCEFIENACAWDCVFTTYGCTGSLRRALQKSGFTIINRAGFPGKRNSTLAVRGFFTSEFVCQTF